MSDGEEEGRGGGGGKDGGRGGEKNHNKYRKDKPWDSASIDHWSIPDWKDENMKVFVYVWLCWCGIQKHSAVTRRGRVLAVHWTLCGFCLPEDFEQRRTDF